MKLNTDRYKYKELSKWYKKPNTQSFKRIINNQCSEMKSFIGGKHALFIGLSDFKKKFESLKYISFLSINELEPLDFSNNTNKLPWALDLALVFNWTDIIDDDQREKNKSLNIFLDGANIAWHRGALLRKKFKCRQFPLSAGVIEALNYEHWLNHKIVAYIP